MKDKIPFDNEKVITCGIDQRLPKELVYILWHILSCHVRDAVFEHRKINYLQVFELSAGANPGSLKIRRSQEQPRESKTTTVYLSDNSKISALYGLKIFVINDGTYSTMSFPEEY